VAARFKNIDRHAYAAPTTATPTASSAAGASSGHLPRRGPCAISAPIPHPDHDTIRTFRRHNLEAVGSVFFEVLELARELKLLKLGCVSLDGTPLMGQRVEGPQRHLRARVRTARAVAAGRGRTARASRGERPRRCGQSKSSPKKAPGAKSCLGKWTPPARNKEARAQARVESERAESEAAQLVSPSAPE